MGTERDVWQELPQADMKVLSHAQAVQLCLILYLARFNPPCWWRIDSDDCQLFSASEGGMFVTLVFMRVDSA
jgi:hypothetical protein